MGSPALAGAAACPALAGCGGCFAGVGAGAEGGAGAEAGAGVGRLSSPWEIVNAQLDKFPIVPRPLLSRTKALPGLVADRMPAFIVPLGHWLSSRLQLLGTDTGNPALPAFISLPILFPEVPHGLSPDSLS